MTRAQRRRKKREDNKKTKTYNLTEEQLNIMVRERIKNDLNRVREEAKNEAVDTAIILLLTLPLEVLMDHYWKKSYKKRIPEFTNHVLDYYNKWQNDELDIEKLKEDLWEYGGVRIERS